MKKQLSTLLLLMAAALCGLTGCSGNDDGDDKVTAVALSVQLQLPDGFSASALGGHTVVLSNAVRSYEAATTEAGLAAFAEVVPDVYDLSCTWDLTAAEYAALSGDAEVSDGCSLSGSLTGQVVSAPTTLTLTTQVAVHRSLVIGKVYETGSKDNNNTNYRAGKFLEIFNQSDADIDVAGLCIGLTETVSPTPAWSLANLHEVYADTVLMLKQVFRIPVAEAHLLAPGRAIVIAVSAQDHTVNNDRENDLTHADFETAGKEGSNTYPDNPNVPNLEPMFTTEGLLTTMNLVNGGPCGIVIFRLPADVTELPLAYAYGKEKGSQYHRLPKRYVIDGVDIVKNKANDGPDVAGKRLYPEIDATYTYTSNVSGWNNEVLYRKTSERTGADGHKILVDTNNSLNDFLRGSTTDIRPWDYE